MKGWEEAELVLKQLDEVLPGMCSATTFAGVQLVVIYAGAHATSKTSDVVVIAILEGHVTTSVTKREC